MKATELRIGNWATISEANSSLNNPVKITYILDGKEFEKRYEPIQPTIVVQT